MNCEAPTLLDNKSSSAHPTSNPTYREYLLRDLTPQYARAYDYYIGFDSSNLDFSQKRFLSCHSSAVFARNNTSGYVRVLARSCHLRFCPICNRSREKLIRHNVTEWLEKKSYPKFLTLTLKNSSEDLRGEIDRLYQCFRSLRRIKMIKDQVRSGIWFFQITRSKDHQTWHPHLHCILTGGYIPVRKLSKAWMKLTEESMIVDIRLIRDVQSAACEVARYCSSACNVNTLNCDEMFVLDCALKHRRICGTWGGARKQRLTSSPKYNSNDWTVVGSWSAVVGCKSNLPAASEIYSAWERGVPLAANISVTDLDDFAKDLSPPDTVIIENFYKQVPLF
jgi:hypothetical protein